MRIVFKIFLIVPEMRSAQILSLQKCHIFWNYVFRTMHHFDAFYLTPCDVYAQGESSASGSGVSTSSSTATPPTATRHDSSESGGAPTTSLPKQAVAQVIFVFGILCTVLTHFALY